MIWNKKTAATDKDGMKEEVVIAAGIVEEMNVRGFSAEKATRVLSVAIQLLQMQKHGTLRELSRRVHDT